jgi:hypothetical protein
MPDQQEQERRAGAGCAALLAALLLLNGLRWVLERLGWSSSRQLAVLAVATVVLLLAVAGVSGSGKGE